MITIGKPFLEEAGEQVLLKAKIDVSEDTVQNYTGLRSRFNNCGLCNKCRRTLITLDALGKADLFSGVFDVPAYYKDRDNAFAWLLETMEGDDLNDHTVFARDIYGLLQEKGIEIPKNSVQIYKKQKRDAKKTERIYKLKRTILHAIGRV